VKNYAQAIVTLLYEVNSGWNSNFRDN